MQSQVCTAGSGRSASWSSLSLATAAVAACFGGYAGCAAAASIDPIYYFDGQTYTIQNKAVTGRLVAGQSVRYTDSDGDSRINEDRSDDNSWGVIQFWDKNLEGASHKSTVDLTEQTNLTLDSCQVTGNVIGGTFVYMGINGEAGQGSSVPEAGVASTNLTIKGGSITGSVYGGGFVDGSQNKSVFVDTEAFVSNVSGDTSVTIQGGASVTGSIIGGGVGKTTSSHNGGDPFAAMPVKANVGGNTSIVVDNGEVAVPTLVGGGYAFNYNFVSGSSSAHAEANVTGNTSIRMTNSKVTSSIIDYVSGVAVIAGGLAQTTEHSSGRTENDDTQATVSGTANLTVEGSEIEGAVVAGGYAYGTYADATTGSNAASLIDTTVNGNVYGGGYAKDATASAATTSTQVVLNNVSVDGSLYAGGYAEGEGADASVGSAELTVIGSTISGDLSAGGLSVSNGTATVKQAMITLENTTVEGSLILSNSERASRLSEDAGTTTGADKVTLALTGRNVVSKLSGVADRYVLTATEDNADGNPILTLGSGESFDLSGASVAVKNAFDGLVITGADVRVDEGTTMTVSSAFLTTTYTFADEESGSTLTGGLTVTDEGLQVGEGGTGSISGDTTVTDNTKTLSMAFLGSAAFVNQGAEFIADEGLDAMTAAARQGRFTGFAAVHGGRSTYETGSHVSLWGATLAAGAAGRIGSATVAGFVEAGWASSDSSDSGASGDADHDYYGVGAAVRYEFDNPFYLDGSVRLGVASTDFSGRYAGTNADYDSDSLYTTAHVGGGWLADIGGGLKLDVYGRYIFSYIEGDDATLSNHTGTFEMDDVTAQTIRAGAALLGNMTPAWSWRAGLAYEHVFNGDAESAISYGGLRGTLDTPTLEGNTGILDLGAAYEEAGSPWRFGLGLKGYAGDRQGVSGSVDVLYRF